MGCADQKLMDASEHTKHDVIIVMVGHNTDVHPVGTYAINRHALHHG